MDIPVNNINKQTSKESMIELAFPKYETEEETINTYQKVVQVKV
jgi:hypothetical protein